MKMVDESRARDKGTNPRRVRAIFSSSDELQPVRMPTTEAKSTSGECDEKA
jgi:hypothetical protein